MANLKSRVCGVHCGTLLGWLCAALAAVPAAGQGTNAAPPNSSSNTLSIGPAAPVSQFGPQPISHQVSRAMERLEMIVNTSRILTLEQRIPQAQVNNPEILGLTALSETQLQILARRPGVTQVNIWDEKGAIRSIDVMVYGDVQELSRLLQREFPRAALRITPISTGVLIQGYVDDPNVQSRIVEIAQNYYPNVINNITIGGVQQVLLQVRVLEVSRTKMQSLGIDMAAVLENGSFFGSSAAGLLRPAALTTAGSVVSSGNEILTGRIASNGDDFFFFVEALKRNNLAKIVADPNISTVSGRPAFMNSGGEIPIIVPQSLGTVSIEYRRYGTQLDFVPIVLGNGVIRTEVYARVSELDDSRSVTINGTQVPALKVREANTAAELKAGQTLAVAGLVQTRCETATRGVPGLMDVPVAGAFFRRTSDMINEVELLIMVTPQLVDGMDPQDLCEAGFGPGSMTTTPGDCQLFVQGHIEVPPGHHRPAHFQQPFPTGAAGHAAAGQTTVATPGTGSSFSTGPAGETLPPPMPMRAPAGVKPAPAAPPALPGASLQGDGKAAATTGGSPAFDAKFRAASPPSVVLPSQQVGPSGLLGPAPSASSASSAPASAVEPLNAPGLIGPIGYEAAK